MPGPILHLETRDSVLVTGCGAEKANTTATNQGKEASGMPTYDSPYDRGIKVYLFLAAIEVLRYTFFWLR